MVSSSHREGPPDRQAGASQTPGQSRRPMEGWTEQMAGFQGPMPPQVERKPLLVRNSHTPASCLRSFLAL